MSDGWTGPVLIRGSLAWTITVAINQHHVLGAQTSVTVAWGSKTQMGAIVRCRVTAPIGAFLKAVSEDLK